MLEVSKSALSDHDRVEICTNYITDEQLENSIINEKNGLVDKTKNDILRQLNFHMISINWKDINEEIEMVPWEEMLDNKDAIESSEIIEKEIIKICLKHVQKKGHKKGNSKIPRERKKLLNRIKMLKREKHRAYSNEKKRKLDDKIVETEENLLGHKRIKKLDNEKKAIDCMKENPKMFYAYINKQKNRKNEIGPFKINNEYIYEGHEICNSLKKEYLSQFTKKSKKENIELFNIVNNDDLSDIDFGEEEIQKAIDELDENSSAGPDGIPAILLKKTKETISKPLKILMRKSIDDCSIADTYKLAYVTPIHKGGSRQKPEQYRPVSLTSHVMKVFERVVKKRIMEHLTENQAFNKGQHGFVPGRSTQTQLLSHYGDVYDAIVSNGRLDTVYLDFAKAFDKVDHDTLLEKVRKHKISGKLGKWIREFLKNRKFRVVANGYMSDEEEVTSGVPQGTVLAAILFVIMISDIDEEVLHSIVGSYADDTRVSKRINSEEDRVKMQTDLEAIYKWAKDNKMEFNEKKFEQMVHGSTRDVVNEAYTTPNGEKINVKNTVKDLGVHASNDLMFKEHIDKIINATRVVMGMLLRTFKTREKEPMITIYNTYIRSRMEYCCVLWSPTQQKDINRLEGVQKTFTSKIQGMEGLNYHERLESLKMYSLERRRDRYQIIYGWQQITGIKENILELEVSDTSRRLMGMKIKPVPTRADRGQIKESKRSKVFNSPKGRVERLLNSIPRDIRILKEVSTDTFKAHLDRWLMEKVPDQPRGGGYAAGVAAGKNSVQCQAEMKRTTEW